MTTANVNITKVLLKRGNTAQNAAYTGVNGEVVVDLQAKTLRIHDGSTVGGFPITGGGDGGTDTVLRANVGAYQIWANANAASQTTAINGINANLGAFQTYANATFGGNSYTNANVKSYLNVFNGNIIPSANVTYSLGNITHQWRDLWVSNNTIYIGNTPIRVDGGTLLINNSPVTGGTTYSNANVTAYLTPFFVYANTTYSTIANAASQQITINTINANLGAYQIFANTTFSTVANAGSQQTQINSLTTNAATQQTQINSINANVTAANIAWTANATTQAVDINNLRANITAANAVINTIQAQAYSNVNAAAYLAGNVTTGNLTVAQNAVILGNLRVQGTQTTVNAATLTVNDLYVTVANGAAQASDANGAGLRIAGALANIAYSSVSDSFVFNKSINANLTTANVVFSDSTIQSTAWTGTVANLTNGGSTISLGSTGTLTLPGGANFVTYDQTGAVDISANVATDSYIGLVYANRNWMYVDADGAYIWASDGANLKTWTFGLNGNLRLPTNGMITYANGQSILSGITGDITFDGYNISSTANVVNITASQYAQLQSGNNYIWVDNSEGGEGAYIQLGSRTFEFTNISNSPKLKLPVGGDIVNSDGESVLGGANLGKFKIDSGGGYAYLSTTDDADGYGGYNITINPNGEGSAFINIPNNANADLGQSLTINSFAANSSVRIQTDWADPWIFGANGVLTLGNATISNDNEFRLWAEDIGITVYRNGRDGYGVFENEVTVYVDNNQATVTNPDGFEIKQGNLVIPNDKGIYYADGSAYAGGGGTASVTTDNETPSTPSQGDLWYNTGDGRMYVRWADTWIDTNPTTIPSNEHYTGRFEFTNSYSEDFMTVFDNDMTIQTIRGEGSTVDCDINIEAADDVWIRAEGDEIGLQANSTVTIATNNWINSREWTFDTSGNLSLPSNGYILNNDGTIYGGGGGAVDLSNYQNNIVVNAENRGFVVDAGGDRRVGFMKYFGFEGSFVHANGPTKSIPFRIGRVTADDITLANVDVFTTEVYVGANGRIRIGDDDSNTIDDPVFQLEVLGNLLIADATSNRVTAVLASGTDSNFQIAARNGVSTNNTGDEVARFGLQYNGVGWNSFTQYIRGGSSQDGHQVLWAGNTAMLQVNSDSIEVAGEIRGLSTNVTLTADTVDWVFNNDGNLTLPYSSTIGERPNPSGFPGYSVFVKPTGYINDNQQLVVYPTGGQDYNHLHLTSGDLYDTELFLGNDNLYVKLSNTGNVEIRADDDEGTSASWSFDPDGTLSLPGNIFATADLALQISSGVPSGVANWNGQGGWNQGFYSNIATTGGTGSGLRVDVAAGGGGYININAISIHTPGTGYTDGDVITINNENNLPGTFTVTVTPVVWEFGKDGSTTFPDHKPVTITGNLTVGNLIVTGNSTVINTESYVVSDNIIQMANANPADTLDLGFVAHRTVDSTLQHTGLVRDASAGLWKLFSNVVAQPGNTVDFTDVVYDSLQLGGLGASSVTLTGPINFTSSPPAYSTPGIQWNSGWQGDIYGNTQVASYLSANPQAGTYSNTNAAAYLTSQNITSANIGAFQTYANATFSTGGGSSYSNANVVANLQNFVTSISTTANITTTANVIAPNFLFANGVNILSTVAGGGGSYANADAAAYLAANSAIYLGNPVTRYPLQANVTQTFIGNTTTIGAGSNQLGSTYILNNAYFGANGAMYARNTQTGAAQLSFSGSGGFTFAGTTGAVTANAYQSFGLWASISSTGISTSNGLGITSAGTLTVQGASGLVTTQSSGALFNTTATTINLGGAATVINMGAATVAVSVGSGAGTVNANHTGNVNVTNLYTANAVIAGGYVASTSNITVASGGNISGVGNLIGITSNTTITAGNYVTSFLSNGVMIASNVIQTASYYETYSNVTNTGGNITFNFGNTSVFYATLTANVTANITNLANNLSTVTGFTVIIDQGATPYRIANIQFNGGAVTNIKWAGTTVPTGTASNTDIVSISLINLGNGNYRVLGQQSSYG